jgi:nucleoid DNA-binding protein
MITTAACNGEEVVLSSDRRFKVAERAARPGAQFPHG